MPLPKKTDKKETETETISVSDDEEVLIKGPYENDFGRSIRIETRGYGAFVGESNLLDNIDISKVEVKSFKNEKDILKNVVKDISKLKWTKNFEKGKGRGVDMGPTNDILKDILEVGKACQKALTSLALIAKRSEKKKGD